MRIWYNGRNRNTNSFYGIHTLFSKRNKLGISLYGEKIVKSVVQKLQNSNPDNESQTNIRKPWGKSRVRSDILSLSLWVSQIMGIFK